ncbi:lipoprotein [Spirochaetia bacterium]|nr:lipoprotein [Spirochaetia bacterium]
MKFLLIYFALLSVFFSGCSRDQAASIAREDHFTLDIGRLEDQLALYNLEGDRSISRSNIAMRDGLFYISDANGQKIVQYTSYGDILFMIYNEETNPAPLTLRTNIEDSAVVTRWAFSWPLREPGHLAVDSRKHIYAEDRLPDDRYSVDPESKALLDSIVLHFDQDGRFVEYLGQEGIGGSPFPRISGIYTSIHDEIAVVCRIPTGWNIHWFDSAGTLLYLVQLKNSAVPVPPDWPRVSSSMDAIIAAPDSRTLYFKVDYYRDTFDESTNTRSGNEPDSSIIWIMDVETGSYTSRVEVPFLEYTFNENGRRVNARVLYSMLGAIRDGWVYLSFPVEYGYSILILNSAAGAGGDHRQGTIRVDRDELQLNTFDLSADGILSALLVSNYKAKLVWWRTDKILGAITP